MTWVSSDGSVRYDTHADAATLGNHADREEIREALQTGAGEASRLSETLMERTIYEARKLSDGSVLRISKSHKSHSKASGGTGLLSTRPAIIKRRSAWRANRV